MNAPLRIDQQAPLADNEISLDDKYTLECGRVFMTGTRAIIRLAVLQHQYPGRYPQLLPCEKASSEHRQGQADISTGGI